MPYSSCLNRNTAGPVLGYWSRNALCHSCRAICGWRGFNGEQVFLHDHVSDQPELDWEHAQQDVAFCKEDDSVCGYIALAYISYHFTLVAECRWQIDRYVPHVNLTYDAPNESCSIPEITLPLSSSHLASAVAPCLAFSAMSSRHILHQVPPMPLVMHFATPPSPQFHPIPSPLNIFICKARYFFVSCMYKVQGFTKRIQLINNCW